MPAFRALRATFSGWKLPNGQKLSGTFEIELLVGRDSRYTPRLMPTGATFSERGKTVSFAQSKLDEAKAFVEKQFETKLKDWA